MSKAPHTSDVIRAIGAAGVIVGSWPAMGEYAKDVDVVIRPRKNDEPKNKVFQALYENWREYMDSAAPGHVFVRAEPQPVEVFESLGFRPDDEDKSDGCLTYNQATRRATRVDCYGVKMKAVV